MQASRGKSKMEHRGALAAFGYLGSDYQSFRSRTLRSAWGGTWVVLAYRKGEVFDGWVDHFTRDKAWKLLEATEPQIT